MRQQELSLLWRSFVVASINSSTVLAIPILTAVATFAAYSLLTGLPLTAGQGAPPVPLLAARAARAACLLLSHGLTHVIPTPSLPRPAGRPSPPTCSSLEA